MSSDQERRRVAVYMLRWLKSSETFVDRQVRNMTTYEPLAVCWERLNEDRFPTPAGGLIEYPVAARADELAQSLASGVDEASITREAHYVEQEFQTAKPDLLHVHFGHHAVRLLPLVQRTGIPFITTFHGMDATRLLADCTFEERYPGLLDASQFVIAASKFIEQSLIEKGVPAERIVQHYIGVPVPDEVTRTDGPPSAVQVSRFVEVKGIDTTLRAFALAADADPSFTLTLIGDGPLRAPMEKLAADLGIADRVDFAGDLPYADVRAHLSRATFFVHPSHRSSDGAVEGLSTAIQEAMAHGLAILATRSGGIPESVTQDVGHLVAERDHHALAEAMVHLVRDPDEAKAMGQRARQRIIDHFDIVKNTAALEALYDRAIELARRN